MRSNSMRAKTFCLGLLWCVMTLAALAFAAEPQPTEEPTPSKPLQAEAVPQDATKPAPAQTFTPSEQIKADSSVPFPIDI